MENKAQEKQGFTNVNTQNTGGVLGQSAREKEGRVSITTREAMEYRDFKRQQKRAEILSAIARSEGLLAESDDVGRIAEHAARLRQAAVQISPSRLSAVGEFFHRRGVATDCIIGGNGETLTKVKRYEAKLAVKMQAKELTLVLSPYQVAHCHYAELRKEIRKISRAAKKVRLKVWIDKDYPQTNISRVARLCGEMGVSYFCVPYFEGCEKLRIDLPSGCKLQISGVQTLEQYCRLVGAGVGRIVTDRGWEIYNDWMREVEKINFPQLNSTVNAASKPPFVPTSSTSEERAKTSESVFENHQPTQQTKREEKGRKEEVLLLPPAENQAKPTVQAREKNSETDYRCRLEGTELKFL